MIAVVMALGADASSNEEASGGSDDSKKGTGTKDMGGIQQDVMAAQRAKFHAS
jgi:hypothetical protein